MSEEKTTPVPIYYFGNMNQLQKKECIQSVGISKSAFYRNLKSPGRFKVSEAREFIAHINQCFNESLNTEDFLKSIDENGQMVKRSKKSSHVH